MACRRRRLARKVVGVVRRTSAIEEVLDRGAADEVFLDISEGVASADLVVMATPVDSIPFLTRKARSNLPSRCVVTDVGSVKNSLVRRMERLLKATCYFVGAHPMAGSEKSGIAIASPRLFENAPCIVTPTKNSNPTAVRKIRRFWEAIGCRVFSLSPRQHDIAVALVSHLPHVAAASLVNAIAEHSRDPIAIIELAGTGFKDTTRIAAGSPRLWGGICMENRDAILRSLDSLAKEISEFSDSLRNKDREALEGFFEKARAIKEASNRSTK